MSMMKNLLTRIANTPDCFVHPPSGYPTISQRHTLLPEIREFYELCGGVSLYTSAIYSMNIVSPNEFVLANPEILTGATQDDLDALIEDRTGSWYIIGNNQNYQFITIDLAKERSGRCYDSFWESYAMKGYMPIIALSLFDLLINLYNNKGEHWYWLQPTYQRLGDAYD